MMPLCLSNHPAYDGYYHIIADTEIGHWLFHDITTGTRCKQIIAQTVILKEGVELVNLAVGCDHIHILIRTEYDPWKVTAVLVELIAWRLKMIFPFLAKENPYSLWVQTFWKAIESEIHLQNCNKYIECHQPFSSKAVQENMRLQNMYSGNIQGDAGADASRD